MKRQNLWLILVFACTMVLAHKVGVKLHEQQLKIATSRSQVTSVPLAGFHKFASDIHWMLLIQYSGSTDINQNTADEYYRRVRRIVEYDPDFVAAYKMGIMNLGPVAIDKAIELAAMAEKSKVARDDWQLWFQAGQMVMNREKLKYYKAPEGNKEKAMDKGKLRKAKHFFNLALSAPNSNDQALRSYIRVEAYLGDASEDFESRFVKAYIKYYRNSMTSNDMGGIGDTYLSMDEHQMAELLLAQVRVLKERYSDHPQKFEKASKGVLTDIRKQFPDIRIDMSSLKTYGPGMRYSPETGEPLVLFGHCPHCIKDRKVGDITIPGVITLARGPYCHVCGKPVDQAKDK